MIIQLPRCPSKAPCPFRIFRGKVPYCGGVEYPHLRIYCKEIQNYVIPIVPQDENTGILLTNKELHQDTLTSIEEEETIDDQ